jgi:hypothetical protein
MKVPYMDMTGNVRFPHDKHISNEEFGAYFAPRQEDNNVGDHGNTADHHDPDPDLVREAEQTADLAENDRQRAEKLWNDGWQSGHRAGYRDAVEDRKD